MTQQEYSPTDREWAWAAGLFEGEGCISHKPYPKSHPMSKYMIRVLTLVMTDEDVVRRFHRTVGCGQVNLRKNPPGKEHYKPCFVWTSSRWADTEKVLSALLPYLGRRRSAAARALLADPAYQPRTHCLRGHELTPENTYVWKDTRACRTCIRAGKARRKQKK